MSDTEPAETEPVTPYQVKAARALLGWSRMHLGLRSDTSEYIVTTYEKTGHVAEIEAFALSTNFSIRQTQGRIAGRASRRTIGEITKRARAAPPLGL